MPTNPMGILKALSQSPLHIPTNPMGICKYAHEPHGHSQSPFTKPFAYAHEPHGHMQICPRTPWVFSKPCHKALCICLRTTWAYANMPTNPIGILKALSQSPLHMPELLGHMQICPRTPWAYLIGKIIMPTQNMPGVCLVQVQINRGAACPNRFWFKTKITDEIEEWLFFSTYPVCPSSPAPVALRDSNLVA